MRMPSALQTTVTIIMSQLTFLCAFFCSNFVNVVSWVALTGTSSHDGPWKRLIRCCLEFDSFLFHWSKKINFQKFDWLGIKETGNGGGFGVEGLCIEPLSWVWFLVWHQMLYRISYWHSTWTSGFSFSPCHLLRKHRSFYHTSFQLLYSIVSCTKLINWL